MSENVQTHLTDTMVHGIPFYIYGISTYLQCVPNANCLANHVEISFLKPNLGGVENII